MGVNAYLGLSFGYAIPADELNPGPTMRRSTYRSFRFWPSRTSEGGDQEEEDNVIIS